jgi:hypothetical protein
MRAASEASEEERAVLNLIAGWNLPALVKSPAAGTPMLLGAFRPVIVLPEREYSADELENILRHELAHLRRRDIIYKWFAAAVTALHWFNPLMIPLRRELARDVRAGLRRGRSTRHDGGGPPRVRQHPHPHVGGAAAARGSSGHHHVRGEAAAEGETYEYQKLRRP